MILTNNPLVCRSRQAVVVSGSQKDVLLYARDLIHRGHRLLTAPLAASGRMHFSPVRSLLISDRPGDVEDRSVFSIENSLQLLETALSKHSVDTVHRKDYEIIDHELLITALNETTNQPINES
ncbi:hypothetical protein ABB02_01798 [Clostridiaceae bacterium JG1575]|nr:hypothetical protein ABB02_01798 [Clostridiaceae bacterium JG1575]